MLVRRFAAALVAAVLLCSPLATPAARAAQPAQVPGPQARTLPNGLKVVVIEDHAAPVAQVHMWYRFGALDETPGKTGLAHALEHMMFRGTHDLSSAGIDDMTARLGADVNAQTENEITHYYFVVPADRVETIVHLEADRMRGLKLDPADWNLERGAVLTEYAAPGNAKPYEHDQVRNDVAIGAMFNPRGPFRALVERGLVLAYDPVPLEDRRASVVHIMLIVAPRHTPSEVRAAYEKIMRDLLAKGIDAELFEAS